ncbi:MAG TPA: Ig-like domain-containing protein [Gaiellales bacterium]|nr:Ig-like domain-containing protein [Gaiellales bacterium]
MKLHLRALLLGSLLATLVPLASAHAAPGPPGSLAPLASPQLCFAQTPASGCTSAPGLESARAVAITADGHNLYVGGGTSISAFARNPKTGALTQLAGALGCLSSSGGTGCGHALGLSGVSQIALSPDGRHLYAASSISGSVTAFARDVTTGGLTQLRGAAGCVRPGGGGGCASGVGLAGATALVIAPDGRSLYVAGHDANAVASFSIDPVGGALLQLGGKGACVRGGPDAGACLDGRALLGTDALAISPDGAIVYAAAKDVDAVAVLQRDPTTGALSQQPGQTGCIRLAGGLGCATARALAQPSALAIGPGGRDLYVASASGNAVSLLQRDAVTGLLIQPAGTAGCIGQGIADCSAAPLLTGPNSLALGPDATSLTVATAGDGTILTLHRDTTSGLLAATPAPAGCISTTAAGGCQALPLLGPATSLAIAPTGDVLYAATSTGLIALARQAPPVCLKRELRAGVGVPTQILLPCTDPNGDALTYAIASKATHGTLAGVKGGSVTYRPKPGYRGVDAFGVTASDGSGAATTATVTVRVTRNGTGPVVRLAAGPLKVKAGTARATIGCAARTAGGCTGVAILRLGGPRGPIVARTKVQLKAGRAHVIEVPLRAAGRSALAPGSWRQAMLIVIARDKNGNGGTLGRKVVLHSILKQS